MKLNAAADQPYLSLHLLCVFSSLHNFFGFCTKTIEKNYSAVLEMYKLVKNSDFIIQAMAFSEKKN